MSGVDYCVTTMKRPQALERLLLSIAESCPAASVHVADQSKDFDPATYDDLAERLKRAGLGKRPTIHRLPFDCGVSVARNHLVDSTPGEYKLILDDDFVFTSQTDIGVLVRLLDSHPDAGAVGGCVTRGGKVRNGGTRLERRGASLCQLVAEGPYDEHEGIRFRRTDCVPNFVLIRRSVFADVRWDPALKTSAEHLDFFLCLRETPHVVLHTPDVTIDHPPAQAETGYSELRMRGEFVRRMLVKHDAVRLKAVGGTVMELHPAGGLIGYCELQRR